MTPTTTARSERYDKTLANRRLRRRVGQALHHGDEVLPLLDEVHDTYLWAKDGHLHFWGGVPEIMLAQWRK